MPIEFVRCVGGAVWRTAREELFIALNEDEIGSLIDNGLNDDGLAAARAFFGLPPELVGVLLPRKTLYLCGFKEFIKFDKFLRELASCFLRCGELGKVSDSRGLEDHEYLLQARIHQRDIVW